MLLSRPGNDFAWSSWNGGEEASLEIWGHIAELQAGGLPKKMDLTILFAPTGNLQEVSLSSGWGDEFLELATRFDKACGRAYRWSLFASLRL
jgi:hypothetical protein